MGRPVLDLLEHVGDAGRLIRPSVLAAVDISSQMGVDGLYWDEMEDGLRIALITCLGDGYSCALNMDTYEPDHQIAVNTIAGAGHRVAVVERVYEHGGMVMGNGPTAIKLLSGSRMVEQQQRRVV